MITLTNAVILLNGRQKIINAFENGICLKEKQGKGFTSISYRVACVTKVSNSKQLKMLIHKQMLQRLSIALAQVKAGNTSENLLYQIRQIMSSLIKEKEVTTKVYNNIMNSIKL